MRPGRLVEPIARTLSMRLFGAVFGGRAGKRGGFATVPLCRAAAGFRCAAAYAYLFVNRGLGHWPATYMGSFKI